MRFHRWLLMFSYLTFTASTGSAGTPFIYDDFERDDLFDVPWNWFDDPTPEERLTIEDGSLIIEPLVDGFPAVPLPAVSLVHDRVIDFSAEAQFRFLFDRPVFAINPFIAFAFAEQFNSDSGNWVGLATDGILYIGGPSDVTQDTLSGYYSQNNFLDNDLHLRLDAIGSTYSLTTWIHGDEAPSEPQLVWERTNDWSETLAFFMNPESSLSTNIAVRYISMLPGLAGDFSGNSERDADDIDLISEEIRGSAFNRAFDLDGNARVDGDDRRMLIDELFKTFLGDSNLDGEFNTADFVTVFQAGQYEDEMVGNSTWATGDWNGDGEFTTADFITAFQRSCFECGPRVATLTVPEPSSSTWILFGLCILNIAGGSKRQR